MVNRTELPGYQGGNDPTAPGDMDNAWNNAEWIGFTEELRPSELAERPVLFLRTPPDLSTPLIPVYHLLDPAYDQAKGSWRQMLFPKN